MEIKDLELFAEKFYFTYWNDFLTVAGVADYYGISVDLARELIEIGKREYEFNLKQR